MELIVSVLTQYRVLKFVANNVGPFHCFPTSCFSDRPPFQCKEITSLNHSLRSLNIGTYVSPNAPADDPFYPVATATMDTAVFDVVHMFSKRGVSAVPIIDEHGVVVNLFETVDVIVRFFSPFFIPDYILVIATTTDARASTGPDPLRELHPARSLDPLRPRPPLARVPRRRHLHGF